MNLKELKEIITIFEKADISELDLEREGMKVKLRKGLAPEISSTSLPSAGETHRDNTVTARLTTDNQKQESAETGFVEITSPMVGTFYRSSAPNAKHFVEEGDEIEEGQVVCIVEAMKLMNELKAETSGRVSRILVENGHPVEFGEVLFLIEPV